jgi:hypothetical protein
MEKDQKIYLCLEHISPFQMSMKKLGHHVATPHLVIGDICSCSVCGAQSGPNNDDPYIFTTEIHPIYDQVVIEQQFSLLERLLEDGFQIGDAIKVIAVMELYGTGDDDVDA